MRRGKPRLLIGIRTILAAAALSMAVLTVGTVGALPANAASCYATSCAGHDPTTHGCAATSTTSYSGSLATVWNRYSAACDSNWVRGQLTSTALRAGDTTSISISTTDSQGNDEFMCWPGLTNDQGGPIELCSGILYGGSSIAYSDMVDGTNKTYATVDVFDSGYDLLAAYEADQ
jgi:hypothetical protein